MGVQDDIALAQSVLDPYLNSRTKGQGLLKAGKDGAYQQGAKLSLLAALGNNATTSRYDQSEKKGWDDIGFWMSKGKNAALEPNGSGLWCDFAAALVVYNLANHREFKSSLTVISQGDPKAEGHWYVVANFEKLPDSYEDPFPGKDSFLIDIWGAMSDGKTHTVFGPPADGIFECTRDNTLRSWASVPAK